MSHAFSSDQLRSLRRFESVLVLALLATVVAWIYVNDRATGAEAELSTVSNTLATAQDDLRYWTDNFDQLTLQEELADLLSTPKLPGLPTEQESLEFRTTFVAYASEQNLPLRSLDVADIFLKLGDSRYPAVRYSMVVSGSLDSLIGTLQIFESFPTASVVSMDFLRDKQAPDTWELSITLDVVHQLEEA